MLRTILFSIAALIVVMLAARSCGISPAQVEERIMLAELNEEEGRAYRSANLLRSGVIELPSGVQVEVLRLGTGRTPGVEDTVIVHYRGMHVDGRVFDDSYRRGAPAVLEVEQTIEGWRQVLTGLPAGSSVRVVVPPALAYGTEGSGFIGPQETLVFELELIDVAEPLEQRHERDPLQQRAPGLG